MSIFLKILFIFRERGREGEGERERERERERETHQCVVASHTPPTGDLAHNPHWESNWRPFGLQPAFNPLSRTSQGCVNFYQPQHLIN